MVSCVGELHWLVWSIFGQGRLQHVIKLINDLRCPPMGGSSNVSRHMYLLGDRTQVFSNNLVSYPPLISRHAIKGIDALVDALVDGQFQQFIHAAIAALAPLARVIGGELERGASLVNVFQ